MVGRPYPKYKPYEPTEETEEKKEKKKKEPVDPDEAIARERKVLERGKEIRAIDKESKTIAREIAYPRTIAAKGSLKTAGRGIAEFAGQIAKEGIRSTRSRGRKKGGQRVRQSMAYPGVYHPVSTDISLSKAIAMNNWSGANTGLMERDFFGTDNRGRDLLGDRNSNLDIGGNFQQDFFGDKKDVDLLGSTKNVEVDLISGNGKKEKKKEIRYI